MRSLGSRVGGAGHGCSEGFSSSRSPCLCPPLPSDCLRLLGAQLTPSPCKRPAEQPGAQPAAQPALIPTLVTTRLEERAAHPEVSLEGASGPSIQDVDVPTGSPREPGPSEEIRNRRNLSTSARSPVPPAPCTSFPGLAPVQANAFQGNAGSGSQLAGPQRLYLESGRGHSDASRPAPSESWHHRRTQLREHLSKIPPARSLSFPIWFPPHSSCFLSPRKTNRSQAQFHTAVFQIF